MGARKTTAGRLLKREDIPENSKYFLMSDYNWLKFNDRSMVMPDNLRASIVRHHMHDSQEIATKISSPTQFSNLLRSPVPPLYPIDLSEDYRKFVQESMLRRRRKNYDDEDASTIDFSEIETPPDLEDRLYEWKMKSAGAESRKDKEGKSSKQAGQNPANPSDRGADLASQSEKEPLRRSVGPVPNENLSDETARQNLHPEGDSTQSVLDHANGSPVDQLGSAVKKEPVTGAASRSGISEEARHRALAALEEKLDGGLFADEEVAVSDETSSQDSENTDVVQSESSEFESDSWTDTPKFSAAEDSVAQDSVPQDSATETDWEEERKKAHDQGFSEAMNKVTDLHQGLEDVGRELTHLRQDIFAKGQDVFQEMVKIVAEKVLRRHLAINDSALQAVFSEAVHALNGQKTPLRVLAHPQTLARLKKQKEQLGLIDTQIHWIESADVSEGDFQIEGQDEVLRHNILQAVGQQVEALSEELFSDNNPNKDEDAS